MSVRKTLTEIITLGVLAIGVNSCTGKDPDFNFNIDLTGDGNIDKVWGKFGKNTENNREYEVIMESYIAEGKYAAPVKIAVFDGKPSNLFFCDFDIDGDLDIVYSIGRNLVETYVLKNDGSGSFAKPIIIAEYKFS